MQPLKLTGAQALTMLAANIPADVIAEHSGVPVQTVIAMAADAAVNARGRKPRGLDARPVAEDRRKSPPPPADYAPEIHVYPAAVAGNLDAATGHKPGATMFATMQDLCRRNGLRWYGRGGNWYGYAENVTKFAVDMAEAGYSVAIHDTRDEGLAAVAAVPAPEAASPAAPAAGRLSAADAVAKLRAAMPAPKPVGAASVTPTTNGKAAPAGRR